MKACALFADLVFFFYSEPAGTGAWRLAWRGHRPVRRGNPGRGGDGDRLRRVAIGHNRKRRPLRVPGASSRIVDCASRLSGIRSRGASDGFGRGRQQRSQFPDACGRRTPGDHRHRHYRAGSEHRSDAERLGAGDAQRRPGGAFRRCRRPAHRFADAGRPFRGAERRTDFHRRLHCRRRHAAEQRRDPRNPRQPESLFTGVRYARHRPHRDSRPSRDRIISTATPILPMATESSIRGIRLERKRRRST